MVKKIKLLFLIAMFFTISGCSYLGYGVPEQENDVYNCNKDSDCILVWNVCSRNTAINKKYKKYFEQQEKAKKVSGLDCPYSLSSNDFATGATCSKKTSQCRLEVPEKIPTNLEH